MLYKLLYGSEFCAVEHSVDKTGEEFFYFLQLEQKNKELILKKESSFNSQEEIISFLLDNKQPHLLLIINTNKVLFKKINYLREGENVFQKAYPNLKQEEFYSQSFNTENESFVSITRRDYVDKIIKQYEDNKISILDFSLSNISIFNLIDLFKEDVVYLSNAKLIKNKSNVYIEPKNFIEKKYQINGVLLKNDSVLLLSVIVDFFINKKINFRINSVKEYSNKIIFKKGFKLGLLFCLVVLLINFFLFNNYFNKAVKLDEYLIQRQHSKIELEKLKKAVAEKEKLISLFQSGYNKQLSKQVDELIKLLPETVLLNKLSYQPFITSIKENKKLLYEKDIIKVEGVFQKNIDFTMWMEKIERLELVNRIDKLSTEKSKEGNKFYFEVILKNGF